MKYNLLLQRAALQHLKLYSCHKGQCSIATGRGSLYTQALLRIAVAESEFTDVFAENAHAACKREVIVQASTGGKIQEPDSALEIAGLAGKPLPIAVKKI